MSALSFNSALSLWQKRPTGSRSVELCKTSTGKPVRLVQLDKALFAVQFANTYLVRLCRVGKAETRFVLNTNGRPTDEAREVINRFSPIKVEPNWTFTSRGAVIKFRDFICLSEKGELCVG